MRTTSFGHAVAAARAAGRGGEDGRDHAPGAVDHRAAGVAGAHRPAQGDDVAGGPGRCRRRPARRTSRVWPSRPARTSYGPLRGKPRIAPRSCRTRGSAASGSAGASRPATRSTARSLRESNAIACAGDARLAAARQDARVVLAGDDVRVRDDDAVPGDPARALHAEPAGRPEDLHHARRRVAHLGVARDARRRRVHARLRAVDARERVQPRRACSAAAPVGGRTALSRWSTNERCTSRRSSPPDVQPRRRRAPRRRRRPTQAVSSAPSDRRRAALAAGRAHATRRRAPSPSSPTAKTAPATSAPIRPKAGRPRRVAAVGQHERPDPRAEPRPEREAERAPAPRPRSPAPSRRGRAGSRRRR